MIPILIFKNVFEKVIFALFANFTVEHGQKDQKNLFKKIRKVIKNEEFHADFRTVEKLKKKIYVKKVNNKYLAEISTFCTVGKNPQKIIFEKIKKCIQKRRISC